MLVARRLAGLRGQIRAVRGALATGASTVWEVVTVLQPDIGETDVAAAIAESVGVLDWLVAHRQAVWRSLDGVVHFTPTTSAADR